MLARTRQPDTGVDVEESRLRSSQAFLHVERRDGGLDWVAAGIGSGGSWYRWSPQEPDKAVDAALLGFFNARAAAPSVRDLAGAVDRVVEELDRSATEMMGMLSERGVEQVVVSPGAGLDGVPVHLLDFGPAPCEVAYAPSLKFLDAIIDLPSDRDQVTVLSNANAGNDFLPRVNDEAAAIVRLFGKQAVDIPNATPTDLHRASGSRVMHLACHGIAGPELALRGLLLDPGLPTGFVSVADILRKDPLLGTELVFLSACSSSVACHDITLVQAFGGVDFAFLAAGARAAVSTLWDIVDVTAAMFAVIFYSVLIEDFDVPMAYHTAQNVLRSDLDSMPAQGPAALDAVWPNWLKDWRRAPMRSHRVHWGAYRISGLVYQ